MRGEKFITFRCFGAEYYCIIFFIAFMSIILCINLMFLPIHFLFHDTSKKQPAQQKRDEEVSEAGTIEEKEQVWEFGCTTATSVCSRFHLGDKSYKL